MPPEQGWWSVLLTVGPPSSNGVLDSRCPTDVCQANHWNSTTAEDRWTQCLLDLQGGDFQKQEPGPLL